MKFVVFTGLLNKQFTKEQIFSLLDATVDKTYQDKIEEAAVVLPNDIDSYVAVQEWAIAESMLLVQHKGGLNGIWIGILVNDDIDTNTLVKITNR